MTYRISIEPVRGSSYLTGDIYREPTEARGVAVQTYNNGNFNKYAIRTVAIVELRGKKRIKVLDVYDSRGWDSEQPFYDDNNDEWGPSVKPNSDRERFGG